MQFVSPAQGEFSVVLASQSPDPDLPPPTDVTSEEVRQMILYLRRAKDRATAIRERSPAGSYMESLLTRTIDGITLELSQLDYLLAQKPVVTKKAGTTNGRMRPAI